ncbi:hypothetical protein M0R45_026640 [Rubus argutus]|uniref:WAT1-related protein n=1 Tax=Rubus argutus TaxID=59490 RepID=A0AAW1WZV0_RUBAR
MGQQSSEISSNVVADGLMKPVIAMVGAQIAYAAMYIFYKLAADSGMNLSILVAYRLMFSSAIIVPLAVILERNSRPKLTLVVLFQAFLCGLFGGSLSQNLFIQGLVLTSPNYVSATANLIPAVTFIMAICFRLEKLTLGSHAGKAKLVGTVVVDLLGSHHLAPSPSSSSSHRSSGSQVLGSFLALGSVVSYAMWLIVQTKMSKKYPCHYSSTALMSVMGSAQSVAFALCVERDWSQWKLGWNIKLCTAAYSGIVTSVVGRGSDLKLSLGSVLGGILIISGLYMVLWGKSKEMKKINNGSSDQEQAAPAALLPSSTRPQLQESQLIEVVTRTRALELIPLCRQ